MHQGKDAVVPAPSGAVAHYAVIRNGIKKIVADEQTQTGLQTDQAGDENGCLATQRSMTGGGWIGADAFEVGE